MSARLAKRFLEIPMKLQCWLLCLCLVVLSGTLSWAQELEEESNPQQLQKIVERLDAQERQLNDLIRSLSHRNGTLLGSAESSGAGIRNSGLESRFRPVYIINRDGTDLRFLVAAPGMVTTGTPQWSHDSKAILLDSTSQTDQVALSRIWAYGVAGPFQGMIRHLGAGNTPTWSPDDSQIAYMVNPGNPDNVSPGAWIMNADGTNKRKFGQGWYTRWSPDGKEICVLNPESNPYSLLLYHTETGERRQILGGDIEVIFGGANWSRDGQRLVTLIRRDGEQQLITINATGDRDSIQVVYRERSSNRALVGPPVLSPDGKEILFSIQDNVRGGRADHSWKNTYIYLISADGNSEPRLLEGTKIGRINRSSDWSPDGSKIIFSSER